jgi:hypothetical protein
MEEGVMVVVQVTRLPMGEVVRLDPDRLGALYRQLGAAAAEDVVCRAVEDLALRLSQSEENWHRQDWTGLRKGVRSVIAIADQVGMTALARVAGDVIRAIDANDAVAAAATLARLLRVGERSLTAVWDLQDLSI